MVVINNKNDTVFGIIKTLIDAHTMGIYSVAALLRECGYKVMIAPESVQDALGKIEADSKKEIIKNWIVENKITNIGISYRLDPRIAVSIVGILIHYLNNSGLYGSLYSQVRAICFSGLKPACEKIGEEFGGKIDTFCGGESVEETLLKIGVPIEMIPQNIVKGCRYDKELLEFGTDIIKKGEYKKEKPLVRKRYPEYGKFNDTLLLRLDNNFAGEFHPLIRAHSGPYSADLTREQCLKKYSKWCRELAEAGYLDILSIGCSQLSQSNFGEDWFNKTNGGGVPVNSEKEYHDIWESASPMLVRTYSGTNNVVKMAEMYERSINIAWHALSLWWFDELDGRGPNKLYDNLRKHLFAIQYIATTNKPVETNVPHHFAFRGCDDLTYIVSEYLAAKTVKKYGGKTFILQNMLNTPRSTWGVQDLAKSRVLIKLIKSLEDDNYRVIIQTRAGLDYFKSDIEEAKIQLAAVTALMDDIDPENIYSPEIIHVVSYCEALYLATPEIINDSIKIVRAALKEYRKRKREKSTPDVFTDDIQQRTYLLEKESKKIINAMEENIPDLYSPEGLYIAFASGWLPVPELWSTSDEFKHAKEWTTKFHDGGIWLVDHDLIMPTEIKINQCVTNIPDAICNLKFLRRR